MCNFYTKKEIDEETMYSIRKIGIFTKKLVPAQDSNLYSELIMPPKRLKLVLYCSRDISLHDSVSFLHAYSLQKEQKTMNLGMSVCRTVFS